MALLSATRLLALLALLASPGLAAPQRVASLNLCADQLALLLARPGQLVSVSRLGADPLDSPLAVRARGLHHNNGRMESVAHLRPDLVLTGGFANLHAGALARRLGARVVDVPAADDLAGVRRNIRAVASALGDRSAGERLIARMDADLGPLPPGRPALFLTGGGYTIRPDSLGATVLAHAGLRQQDVPNGRVDLERLIANPPEVLVVSRYRPGQASLNARWLDHPALKALPATMRTVEVDGRAWMCIGPLASATIPALRTALR